LRQLVPAPSTTLRVLELGAGDGSLLLSVAREIAPGWPPVELTLLDRLALVDGATVAEYAHYGWTARSSVMDVLDWARSATESSADAASRWHVVIANLFLHHFDGLELTLVLNAIAASTDALLAFEPRRGWRALAGSHLIGVLGTNAVTRTDAVLNAIAASTDALLAFEPRRGWRALAGSHLIGVLGTNAVTRTDAVLSVRAGFRKHELTALWPRTAGWSLQEMPSGAFSHCFRATRSWTQ